MPTPRIGAPSPSVEQHSLYDCIEYAPGDPAFLERRPYHFRFRSTYQGQSEWTIIGTERTIRFRACKVPWQWSGVTYRYWNFATREEFEGEMNTCHGLAVFGTEPLDPVTLQRFREEIHAGAETGFFHFVLKRWIRCKPTFATPANATYKRFLALAAA